MPTYTLIVQMEGQDDADAAAFNALHEEVRAATMRTFDRRHRVEATTQIPYGPLMPQPEERDDEDAARTLLGSASGSQDPLEKIAMLLRAQVHASLAQLGAAQDMALADDPMSTSLAEIKAEGQ